MRIYNYAKIPLVSAIALGLDKIRRHTPSGDVIINESDLQTYGSERNKNFKKPNNYE